jgi:hypothetical protein
VSETKTKGFHLNIGLTIDIIAVVVSLISFVISAVTIYESSLKPPEMSFLIAPYVKQVVDNQSHNEAFFIPLTVINRGAQPGTLFSFELNVTHVPSGEEQKFFGQYFTADNSQSEIGAFFTPITLNGYSSEAVTVCFYPLGQRSGNFFARKGSYRFEVLGRAANVRDASDQIKRDAFSINVDDGMLAVMQGQPDGEYIYPMAIQALP